MERGIDGALEKMQGTIAYMRVHTDGLVVESSG